MKVCFDSEKLQKFLDPLDGENGIYCLEKDGIYYSYSSSINGVWKDHYDLVLEVEKS